MGSRTSVVVLAGAERAALCCGVGSGCRAQRLALDEREQIGIDNVHMRRRHSMRSSFADSGPESSYGTI